MTRDEKILALAKEFHVKLFELYESLGDDQDAGIAVLELATAMYKHFGSPDGNNKGRTNNKSVLYLPVSR